MKKKQKPYRTSGGVELTEEVIESLVAEAERGYPLEELRRRGRPALGKGPSTTFQVRLDSALREALEARAKAERCPPSVLVRQALQEFLGVGLEVPARKDHKKR